MTIMNILMLKRTDGVALIKVITSWFLFNCLNWSRGDRNWSSCIYLYLFVIKLRASMHESACEEAQRLLD